MSNIPQGRIGTYGVEPHEFETPQPPTHSYSEMEASRYSFPTDKTYDSHPNIVVNLYGPWRKS